MKPYIRIMLATAGFAVVHSALASHRAKRTAAALVGDRNSNGLYRVCYIGQSAAAFGLLASYARRQPDEAIYEATGTPAQILRGGQLLGLAIATSAASHVGLKKISGVQNFIEWQSHGPVSPMPEAQGPELKYGILQATGPFAASRHPLNFWPLLVLWLNPKMTKNLVAFNAVATAYLAIGSLHEEARLRAKYGDAYAEYQSSEIPCYVPKLPKTLDRVRSRLIRVAKLILLPRKDAPIGLSKH